MNRGDVRWYRFSPPDNRRPVLFLTRDSIIDALGVVTVAPVTSTIRDTSSEVPLTANDGMPRDSGVNCGHLQTVSKDRLGALITRLSSDLMAQVGGAVRFALGF